MRHTASKTLHAYWKHLRGTALAPRREDLDPVAIGRHLTDVVLLECQPGESPTIRIAGSRLCDLFGRELRGELFDTLFLPLASDDLAEMVSIATNDALPVVAGISALMLGRLSLEAELLILPLEHEGRTDRRILCVLSLTSHELRRTGSCNAFDIASFRVLSDETTRFLHVPGPDSAAVASAAERRARLVVLPGGRA